MTTCLVLSRFEYLHKEATARGLDTFAHRVGRDIAEHVDGYERNGIVFTPCSGDESCRDGYDGTLKETGDAMTTQIHDFHEKLTQGEQAETEVCALFSRWYTIETVSMDEQRRGIDRVFTDRHGKRTNVEIKADWKAHETGNAYIETTSNSTTFKKGWVYTTEADMLLYYLPLDGEVYTIQPARLRKLVDERGAEFRTAKAQNDGYHSVGLLVPLKVLETVADAVIEVIR